MRSRFAAVAVLSALTMATPGAGVADVVGYGSMANVVQTDLQYCMVVTLGDQTLDVFGTPVNLGTSAGTIVLTGNINTGPESFDLHAESGIDPARLSFDGVGVSGSLTPTPFTSISLTGVSGSALAGLSGLAYGFDGSATCIAPPGAPPVGCPLPGPFLVTCSGSAALNAFEIEATPAGSGVVVSSTLSYYNSIAESEMSIDVGVTYAEVLTPGTTSIMAVSYTAGFVPGSYAVTADGFSATYFDVSTDAVLDGPITVCSNYPDADGDDIVDGTTIVETALVLLHGEGEPVSFVDRTFSRDTESNVVCAQVSSLSFFVLAIDLNAANPCSGSPDGTACPGDLDPSFDGDGVVTTAIGASYDTGNSVAIQSDGKIVAAGGSHNGTNYDVALVRYNPDGSLDTSFDGDGRVTTAVGLDYSVANSVALQNDGKIVAVGTVGTITPSAHNFAVLRYNADGSLDTTFDLDGKVTTTFGADYEDALSVAIQGDGKIVVAGEVSSGSTNVIGVARYNADGSLDTSFGGSGKVTTAIGVNDAAFSVAVQSDGKIVAAGLSCPDPSYTVCYFALVRYNADGSLDTSFDGDGKVTTAVGATRDVAASVVIQSDGKIVAGGHSEDGNTLLFAVARYNADGSLDPSFDADGKVVTQLRVGQDFIQQLALQSHGRIVATGYSQERINPFVLEDDIGVVVYNADGSLDTTFDGDGKVVTEIGTTGSRPSGVAIQSDGRIVVAGDAYDGINKDFAVLRYLGPEVIADEDVDEPVIAGGMVSSDAEADGASASDPIESSVTSPNGGAVTLHETMISTVPAVFQIDVTAPAASVEDPLVLEFRVDATFASLFEIRKNGVVVSSECTGGAGTASPDPCVASVAALPDGDVLVTVYTSTASQWRLESTTVCSPAPLTGCVTGAKSLLQLRDDDDDAKDRIKWKLSRGDAFSQAMLGDPTTARSYTLCIYDESGGTPSLSGSLHIDPNPNWDNKSPMGFSYVDKAALVDGITKATIRPGTAGQTAVNVGAQGTALPMPRPHSATEFFDQDTAVTVQLINNETSTCWTSEFTTATKNNGVQFKAKAP